MESQAADQVTQEKHHLATHSLFHWISDPVINALRLF